MAVAPRFDLEPVKMKLAACSGADLRALISATYRMVGTPTIVAWVDAACRWELDRRRDRRNLGDLRCGVALDDPALIDALRRLRALIGQPEAALCDLLDEIERLMKQRPAISAARAA